MIDTLTPEELRVLLLSGNEAVRERFLASFGPGLHNFSMLMSRAYRKLQSIEERVPHEMRSAWTYQFLYVAFNNLFTAFHLLFSGLLVPAGNQMRQFGEALAMALLCCHRAIDVFDRLQRDMERFPTHDAIRLVNRARNRSLLGIDAEGWRQFDEITRFYDAFSHSSFLAVASTHIFGTGGRQLGGEFDPAKFDTYRREVSLCLSGAMRLLDTIVVTERHLNESTPAGT